MVSGVGGWGGGCFFYGNSFEIVACSPDPYSRDYYHGNQWHYS